MANPKVADVLKQASLFANDKDGTKFNPETTLAYLNTGMLELYQRRPSAFYVTSIVTSPPTALEVSGEIAVSPEYAEPLAHYVASKCLIEGAGGDDQFNARLAKTHLELFAAS